MPTRWLRPQHIVESGGNVWLVDVQRPAAGIVSPDGSVRLMHWQESDHPIWERRTVVASEDGITRWIGSEVISVAVDGSVHSRPRRGDHGDVGARRDDRWIWIETTPRKVMQKGEHAGGLIWWVGNDPGGDKMNRFVTVLGHEPTTGQVVVRIDAGGGTVATAKAVGDEFWVAIRRERFHRISNSRGVEVVAFSPGGERTVLAPDAVDISVTDPPLVDRPTEEEIQRHVDEVRRDFNRLMDLGEHPELQHESERTLSEFAIVQTGEWPDTTVVVSFRHTARPGLVLRRSFAVFDLRGIAYGSGSRADDLEEDMYSGYVSPRDEAIDGVLET